jgi:putative ATP-binding cassette transporter
MLATVLTQVGLGVLINDLDAVHDWSQRLSPGEQQRFAFARIFLLQPTLLFLDEATSALDERSEAQLYRLLRAAPWRPTIVSVGHRSTLRSFHDQVVEIADFMERPRGRDLGESACVPVGELGEVDVSKVSRFAS